MMALGLDSIEDTVDQLKSTLSSAVPEGRFSFLRNCHIFFIWADTNQNKIHESNSKLFGGTNHPELLSDALRLIDMVMESSKKTQEAMWTQLQLDVCADRSCSSYF